MEFSNMEQYLYGKDIVKNVNVFKTQNTTKLIEIQPLCIDTLNQLTRNDILLMISNGETIFLKPNSIYFKNNCYAIGHTLLGIIYAKGTHFHKDGCFQGFTCLTIDGKLCIPFTINDKYSSMFVLKCEENKFSKEIDICDNWLEYCKNKTCVAN